MAVPYKQFQNSSSLDSQEFNVFDSPHEILGICRLTHRGIAILKRLRVVVGPAVPAANWDSSINSRCRPVRARPTNSPLP